MINGQRWGVAAVAIVVAVTVGVAVAAAVKPFDGKTLDGWKTKPHKTNQSHWTVGTATLNADDPRQFDVADAPAAGGELVNAKGHGVDVYSEKEFGDCVIKLEVMVPKGSNSGVYVHGEYEVQVLDSFGKDENPGPGDMGAIYGAAPPKNPKYRKPGEWNAYEIHFTAPKFDAAGNKTANAKFDKVVLNGVTIHENVQMPGPTPAGVTGKERATGPIMFQGDHGAVSFRNIVVETR